MTRQEERAVRRAFWMQHLRECSMAGEGLWPLQPVGVTLAQSMIVKAKPVPRFARVRIEPPQASELLLPLKAAVPGLVPAPFDGGH